MLDVRKGIVPSLPVSQSLLDSNPPIPPHVGVVEAL